jgi:hypothetical protein
MMLRQNAARCCFNTQDLIHTLKRCIHNKQPIEGGILIQLRSVGSLGGAAEAVDVGGEFKTNIRRVSGVRLRGSSSSY